MAENERLRSELKESQQELHASAFAALLGENAELQRESRFHKWQHDEGKSVADKRSRHNADASHPIDEDVDQLSQHLSQAGAHNWGERPLLKSQAVTALNFSSPILIFNILTFLYIYTPLHSIFSV